MGPAQTRPVPIEQWATHAGLGAETLAELDIPAAFEILVSRPLRAGPPARRSRPAALDLPQGR